MKITVAISGSSTDTTLMAWCAQFVRPGDSVRLVHSYEKRSSTRHGWLNAARTNTDRSDRARRLLGAALDQLRLDKDTTSVDTTAVVGPLSDVLGDEGDLADLLVIGAARDKDLLPEQDIGCPVVLVPRNWTAGASSGRDVAVLCGRDFPSDAIDVAVDQARRMLMSVLVLHSLRIEAADDASADAMRLAETAQAEQLVMQLAPWQVPGGPPIIAEVRSDPPATQLRALADTVSLVVVPAGDETDAGLDAAIRAALHELSLPVLIAP